MKTVVITVNYNGREYLTGCLRSLVSMQPEADEIIVVDNGSEDGSVELVRTEFPEVRVIRMDRNIGFARANNIAVKETDAEFIALINNDCVASSNWLSTLRSACMLPGVGAASSSMRMVQNPDLIDSAGGMIDLLGFAMDRGRGKPAVENDSNLDIAYPCGGAMMIRRSALRTEENLFFEELFMYGEDMELGWRLWRDGWKVVYEPESVVIHEGSASSRKIPFRRDFMINRNHWLILRRHFSNHTLIRVLPWFLLLQFHRGIWHLLKVDPKLSMAILFSIFPGLLIKVKPCEYAVPGEEYILNFATHFEGRSRLYYLVEKKISRILNSSFRIMQH